MRGRQTPLTSRPCSTRWPALLLPLRLEVRRIDGDLCIRVFPDQPFVDAHKVPLSEEEATAGEALFNALTTHDEQDVLWEQARAEWAELARRYGPQRAAWILRVKMENAENVPRSDAAAIPTLFLLPERFVFLVYQEDQLVYSEPGRNLEGPYTLLPAPTADETEPLDGIFDEQSRWVCDFENAVRRGMGIKIPLIPDHAAATELRLSEIVVVGLASDGEEAGARAFEHFIDVHRYTDGIEFLSYGTPTNNTQASPSGYSQSEDDLVESFDVEVNPLPPGVDTVGGDLARALGLPSGSTAFRHVKGANLATDRLMRLLVDAVWPCTGEYFFSQMLGYERFVAERAMLQDYVREYLRPGGHWATLRVGNLPYGVLPATRTKPVSNIERSGWHFSPVDVLPDADGATWRRFDQALLKTLHTFLPLWLARANDAALVPRAGASTDPDDELTRLLGMSPHSLDYSVRPIVDQTLIGVLYRIFQNRLFGPNSSFEGLSLTPVADERLARSGATPVDQTGPAAAWGYAWNESIQERQRLFEDLGLAPHLKNRPDLLRAFSWGLGIRLGMHLVRVPPAPLTDNETAPPTENETALPTDSETVEAVDEPDGPETYFQRFLTADGPLDADASETLLFELLRRSLQLRSERPGALTDPWPAIEALRDHAIVDFFNRTGTPAALLALADREPRITLTESASGALAGNYPDASAVGDVVSSPEDDGVFDAIAARLRADSSVLLENGLRDIIDGLTHRLDAWWTTLAVRRLAGMRRQSAEQQRGLHCGAYGYLHDIRLAQHSTSTVERDPGAGYIHAPTIAQASAAAILRSAYAAHRNDEEGNAYALNLSSRRVDRALALIDGVQQGQDLSALLGYQFERGLHDAGLDRAIDDFRLAFPVDYPEEEDTAEAAESIGARNVCDGRALATALLESDPRIEATLAALNVSDSEASARDRDTAREIIAELADSNDAVGDLLLYEGVYQAVQGNVERAGAALDALAGVGRPPDIESIETYGGGLTLRHRVCLFLTPVRSDPEAAPISGAGSRAVAEPTLAQWVQELLGDLNQISCRAEFTPADGGDPWAYLTLGDPSLATTPIDFMYMCGALPVGNGDTEIEARLRRLLRSRRGVASDSAIQLKFEVPDASHSSVAHAMELARSLLDLFGNMAVASPSILTHPDNATSAPTYGEVAGDELIGRAETARQNLSRFSVALSSGAASDARTALDNCAWFGIPEAVLDREDDPALLDRARSVALIVAKRLEACGPLIDAAIAASGEARVVHATAALQALFGENFVVLPECDATAILAENRADFETPISNHPNEDRVWLWLQQVAETHPRVRRLETFLIEAEAWGTSVPSLTLAQLPRQSSLEWQGLADEEMSESGRIAGRIRGAQSIVGVNSTTFDPSRFTGFVIDEWTETLPSSTIATGVSFEYDQPASQAPQCFLLAVPGNFDEPEWTADHLAGIVRDTMELARVRLVDLDALPDVGGLVPALTFPIPRPPVVHFINALGGVYGVP